MEKAKESKEILENVKTSYENETSIPWETIQKIQGALKPLGYILEGYREKRGRRILLYLSPAFHFIRIYEGNIVNPDVSGGAALDKS